jgi:hypothetical protein
MVFLRLCTKVLGLYGHAATLCLLLTVEPQYTHPKRREASTRLRNCIPEGSTLRAGTPFRNLET